MCVCVYLDICRQASRKAGTHLGRSKIEWNDRKCDMGSARDVEQEAEQDTDGQHAIDSTRFGTVASEGSSC